MSLEKMVSDEELSPEAFFDSNGLSHKELLKDIKFVWEIVPKIGPYVKQFLDKKFKNLAADAHLVSRNYEGVFILGEVYLEPGAVLYPGVIILPNSRLYVGKDTKVGPNVTIEGDNIIGDNCEIRPGAYLRGDALIGNDVVLRSEIKNSWMMDGKLTSTKEMAETAGPHLSYIGDSVVGRGVNLGASTILSNVRVTWNEIKIKIPGREPISVGYKFGAVFGDYVATGCNLVAEPGTIIGKNSKVVRSFVSGYVHPNMFLKPNGTEEPIDRSKIGKTLHGRI